MTARHRASRKRRPVRSRRLERPLPPPALDLADAFIAEFHAGDDPEQHDTIRWIVLAAGEAIAEKGYPGVWDSLDHVDFLARMPAATPRERAEICLYLLGFTTWLAASSYVDPDRPLDAATAVLATGITDPIIINLCHSLLSRPAAS
jgi:hypothetical protein